MTFIKQLLEVLRLWLGAVIGAPVGVERRRGIPHYRYRDGTRLPVISGAAAGLMLEEMKFAKGIDPVADAFAGTKNTDIYALRAWGRLTFLVVVGVGATGTSTFTVESCDDVTPTTATAIPFWSREILTTDVDSAITRQAAAGFVNTAGSSKLVLIEVHADDLVAGDAFVRLTAVESVDSPVLGGVVALAGGRPGRYIEDINASLLA